MFQQLSHQAFSRHAEFFHYNDTASATFTVKANFKGEFYAYAVDNVDNNGKTQHGEKKPDDLIVETQQHHNGNASVTMSRAKASYKDNSGLDLYTEK